MSEIAANRSTAIALVEDRQAMREGYAFLDEKCALLAGAMLRELRRFDEARRQVRELQAQAAAALRAALGRHGLQGLQCYPPSPRDVITLDLRHRLLLNVPLLDAGTRRQVVAVPQAVCVSPEAEACRARFLELRQHLEAMSALSGNLARLYWEYRRSVRRVRALQDVLLPELDGQLSAVEAQLEELERDESIAARWHPAAART